MDMLWFKFILGLKFFELVSILFAIVPEYGNEYTTKENKNWTSFKNFAPKLNLNHNSYNPRARELISIFSSLSAFSLGYTTGAKKGPFLMVEN